MTRALLIQRIDTAFDEYVGAAGAARGRFQHWSRQLAGAAENLYRNPPREAVSILSLPARTDDLAEIESVANHITGHFSTLVVVGMGGSGMSGEALAHLRKQGGITLHCVDTMDPHSMALLLAALPWSHTAFLVISKSGGTVETYTHMAIFLTEAKKRALPVSRHFFMITTPDDNPLHRIAKQHAIRVISHDPDLGGRFSILSAVGLIPAAAVGVDIRGLRAGAAMVLAENRSAASPAADAAALHMALLEKNIGINMLIHYCDRLGGIANWYRQCWAESLGKRGKGTLAVVARGVNYQHSQLQLYLEGPKDKFFTSLLVDSAGQGAIISADGSDDARLAYLHGHTLGDVAMAEQRASEAALVAAGCPLRSISCAALDEAVLGGLAMHFALEVMLSAQLLGVNAFDQPAIEASKRLTVEYLSGK